jgi:hypothetical protein
MLVKQWSRKMIRRVCSAIEISALGFATAQLNTACTKCTGRFSLTLSAGSIYWVQKPYPPPPPLKDDIFPLPAIRQNLLFRHPFGLILPLLHLFYFTLLT